jgi:hypothetical protein
MQQSVNVPNLISLAPKLYLNNQTASVALAWFNIGRRPVIGGTALLFAVNKDQTKQYKIGEATISGGLPKKCCHSKIECGYASIARIIPCLRDLCRR